MCLYVKSKLKTAEKDIYVAKFFKKSIYQSGVNKGKVKYVSPFRDTVYKMGEYKRAYKMSLKKYIGNSVSIGLHAYILPIPKDNYLFNDEYLDKYHTVLVCKVPKGAKYYLGRNGDIVSNELIIFKEPTGLVKKHTSRILKRTIIKYCIQHIESKYGKQIY